MARPRAGVARALRAERARNGAGLERTCLKDMDRSAKSGAWHCAPVKIRRETYAAPAVQALVAALAEELRGRYGRDGPGGTPTPSDFEPPHGVFLLGIEDGRSVACGGVCRYEGRTGEIRHMYVAPEARRRGLARTILGALEEEARGLGYDAVRLETGRAPARRDAVHTIGGLRANPLLRALRRHAPQRLLREAPPGLSTLPA